MENLTLFPLYQTTCFFIPLVAPCPPLLGTIESRLHYERWFCGHYHTDKEIDKIRFMFQDYTMLPHQISLSAEKEMIRRMQRQAEIVEALGLMDEAQEEK